MATSAAGSLAGGLVGARTGDPLIGIPVAAAFKFILDDVSARALSRRESERIGTALRFAVEKIQERWANPEEEFRNDEFIQPNHESRRLFLELAEGVAQKAQHEHEDRKLRHLGYLLANIVFEPSVDRGTANWALRTAADLSWTQYVLLALLGREDRALPDIERPDNSSWAHWSAHVEFQRLSMREDLAVVDLKPGEVPNLSQNPARFRLNAGGSLLYALLSLDDIAESDLDDARDRLAGGAK